MCSVVTIMLLAFIHVVCDSLSRVRVFATTIVFRSIVWLRRVLKHANRNKYGKCYSSCYCPQAHVQTLSFRTCIQLLTCGFTHRLSYANLAGLIFIVPFHLGCADPLVNQPVQSFQTSVPALPNIEILQRRRPLQVTSHTAKANIMIDHQFNT